jgi:hypothetical protein
MTAPKALFGLSNASWMTRGEGSGLAMRGPKVALLRNPLYVLY